MNYNSGSSNQKKMTVGRGGGTWNRTREVWKHELVPAEKFIAIVSAGQLMHILFNTLRVAKHFSGWFSITKKKKH